jgi:hypothetical protein
LQRGSAATIGFETGTATPHLDLSSGFGFRGKIIIIEEKKK